MSSGGEHPVSLKEIDHAADVLTLNAGILDNLINCRTASLPVVRQEGCSKRSKRASDWRLVHSGSYPHASGVFFIKPVDLRIDEGG